MSGDGLRHAILEPARKRDVRIEPALVEHLAEAARGSTGMLPLLEFALGVCGRNARTPTRVISLADLTALGGLEGALARHADGHADRLGPPLRMEAKRILLALVTDEGTRAPQDEDELVGDSPLARRALESLVQARLIVAKAGSLRSSYEIAHRSSYRTGRLCAVAGRGGRNA